VRPWWTKPVSGLLFWVGPGAAWRGIAAATTRPVRRASGDDSLAATVAVQKRRSRILGDDLRALVGDFVRFCTEADTGVFLAHKDDPPGLP